jgi:hypothetical protein
MMYSLESLDRPSARVIGRDEDDDYDDDATIELELNESAIRALTEAAAFALAAFEGRADPRLTPPEANEPGTRGFAPETPADERGPTALEHEAAAARLAGATFEQEAPAGSRGTVSVARAPRKSRQFALGLGTVAAAAGLLGGVAYLATARAPHPIPIVADSGSRPTTASEAPTSAPALTPVATPPVTPDVPVRFKNPFDASEVFEFPAGTSLTEMRDAVADLLAQRARERQSLFVKRPRRNTKTADGDASVTASRVTPRS